MNRDDARVCDQDADRLDEAAVTQSVRDSLALIAEELSDRATNSPALREALEEVASWITTTLDATAGERGTGPSHSVRSVTSSRHASAESKTDASRPRHSDVTDEDLPLIVQRCRLKAEGARWAVERDEMLREGADFSFDVRPGDQDVIGRARELPNCFLWMNQPRSDIWSRANEYLLTADCFEALAECIEGLMATVDLEDRSQFMTSIDLTAEAQSALRTAVSRVESHPDSDQQMIYYWLRNRASEERFYINRFMKISDPADPARNDDVHDRAFELLEILAPEEHLNAQITRAMTKLKHHVERISEQASSDIEEEVSDEYDWSRAIESIEMLIECGLAPNSEELVELLSPFAEQLADRDGPQGFRDAVANLQSGRDEQESADRAA